MLYIVCPTCGYFLGQKNLQYEEGKKKICDNPKISLEEQEKEITKLLMKLNLLLEVMVFKWIIDICN